MIESQATLNTSLTFLAYTSGIILILVSIFLIKLLIDLSTFTKNLNNTLEMAKTELEPTLREIQVSLKSINSFVKSADQRVDSLRKGLLDTLGIGSTVFGKMKDATWSAVIGAVKGFQLVTKMFQK